MAEYVFSSDNGGRYMHDSLWESYINTKIGCEEKLAKALMEEKIITESAYSNIVAVQEAKLSDKVKAKWKRFIAFIKGVVARFMESITNILYDVIYNNTQPQDGLKKLFERNITNEF